MSNALNAILNGRPLAELNAVLADAERHTQRIAARRRPTFVAQASAHSTATPRREPTFNGRTAAELAQEHQENEQLGAELRAVHPARKTAAEHIAEPAEAASGPRWQGKTYAELSYPERAALHKEDPQLFAAMRGSTVASARTDDVEATWKGKTYAQLTNPERAKLKAEQPELYVAMRAGFNPNLRCSRS